LHHARLLPVRDCENRAEVEIMRDDHIIVCSP
jgi:hypothetical protein